MHTYLQLVRRPAVLVRLLAVLVSAVPVGMLPLAVVLDALARGGSAAAAGAVAAAFALGNGAGILTQGSVLGRVRASRLLPLCAALCVAATAAVALTPTGPLTTAIAVTGAAVAGLALPAVSPAVRGWLVTALPEGQERVGAYALLNVLFQAGVAIGPLAVSALALAGLTRVAAPIAALLALIAAVGLAVADRGGAAVAAVRAPRLRLGGGLALVLLVAASAGFGVGVLQVALPAASVGFPLVSGLAFTALALGEVLGALVTGGRANHGRPVRIVGAALVAMAVVDGLSGLVAAPGAAVAILVGLLGVATGVQSLGSARLLDRVVPAPSVTAAYAAQIAALLVGLSLGSVVAGAVGSMHALFVPAALLPVVAIVLAVGLRERRSGQGLRLAQ